MARDFFSQFDIDQDVEFVPAFRDIKKTGIAEEPLEGKIVSVRFTKPKVFYDVLSDYHAIVFKNVPSEKVWLPKVYDVSLQPIGQPG